MDFLGGDVLLEYSLLGGGSIGVETAYTRLGKNVENKS